MCGRYALTLEPGQLEASLSAEPPGGLPPPRWNVHPDSEVLAVRQRADGTRSAGFVRWGLVPPWSDDPFDPARQINARSETFLDKPMFRDAGRRYRCVVPASHFYEWQKKPKGQGASRPYKIGPPGGGLLLLAGVMQPFKRRVEGQPPLVTLAILTRAADPWLASVHHRLPVMLREDAVGEWLDPGVREPEQIKAALRVIDEDAVEAVPIGTAVNDPANDYPEVAEPIDPDALPPPEPPRQESLL